MRRRKVTWSLCLCLMAAGCASTVGPAGAPAASIPTQHPTRSDSAHDPPPASADLSELRVSTRGWSTDFSRHTVPLAEFIGGGPGKDGIPAIDEPKFAPPTEVEWLEDQEPVIAVGIGEEWRAYPIQILVWHEIVNDTLGGEPIAVTFCPLCHTAIAFSRRLGETVYDFGTTGNLRHSDLIMFDRQTESWWQQATGQAVVGELAGEMLEFLPSQLISWGQFRALHPNADVLSRETGHNRRYGANPYAGYDRADTDPFLLDDRTLIDGRLSPKVRVVGLVIRDEPVAYPLTELSEVGVVNDAVGGTPIVLLWAPGTASGLGAAAVAGGDLVGAATVFERPIHEGAPLTFESAGEGLMRDHETGSTWDFSGAATAGPLAGAHLTLLPHDQPFWFAWGVFRPDSRIWQP